MNKGTKITFYVVLTACACVFAWRFTTNYSRLMDAGADAGDTDLINVPVRDYQKKAQPIKTDYPLGAWGAGLVLSVLGLGLLLAHDLSQFFGNRVLKVLYHGDEDLANPDYEKAEQEWAKGHYLEAIQLLRDYLKANPREQHVALRIAEIYEKDLLNYLAAALEYEEVLKQKLPPERWGWAAIHLCNLYTSKLSQSEKAVALLRRIDAEYGGTAAAGKARERLAQLEAEGVVSAPLPSPDESTSPPTTN